MTTLKRTALAASLVAAGLLGAAGLAQAEEADVSTIYGRASPPNPHIVNRSQSMKSSRDLADRSGSATDVNASRNWPVTVAAPATNPGTSTPPSAAASSADQGQYLTTPATAAAASQPVITPTGRYLEVDGSAGPGRSSDLAVIHEENLDGTPLMDGRGVREGIDYHAATVQSDPLFAVEEIMGRSSPPAPAGEIYFGLSS